jgi:hypothetical protein
MQFVHFSEPKAALAALDVCFLNELSQRVDDLSQSPEALQLRLHARHIQK